MMNIYLPGSKSITNRALIMAALCQKPSILHNALVSDDTDTCRQALKNLYTGFSMHCNDAGTVARFLLPVCAALGGTYHFNGSTRLRERPIKPLLDILQQQNVAFEYLDKPNSLPLKLRSQGLLGGDISIDIHDSSQFLSGLLIAAPLTQQGMHISTTVSVADKPYVMMTLALMKKFGITYDIIDKTSVYVPPGTYQSTTLTIEPDASTASYFFAAAALMHCSVRVMDLNHQSIQGDLQFLAILEKIGCSIRITSDAIELTGPMCLQGVGEVNMRDYSDTFMTLAIIAPFLPTPTRIHGLRHTRQQESDRVAAIVDGLQRVGIKTENTKDSLSIFPGIPHAAIIDTHHDHRIAMSFGVMRLKIPDIVIDGAECVSKTCPDFFQYIDMFI